jgi:hypothetical protein
VNGATGLADGGREDVGELVGQLLRGVGPTTPTTAAVREWLAVYGMEPALVDGLADGSVPDAALPSMAAVLTAAVTELARRTAQTADEHPGEKERRG